PRAIGLIGGKAFERDQRKGDVVGALMRHPVADEIAAAARDDLEPVPRIFLELRALERIELVADEHGDGRHGNLICCRHCEERSDDAIHTAAAEAPWIASLRSQ